MNAALPVLSEFEVTGRQIVDDDGYATFTGPVLLGTVFAVSGFDAEDAAQEKWPGWADYTAWPVQESAAA